MNLGGFHSLISIDKLAMAVCLPAAALAELAPASWQQQWIDSSDDALLSSMVESYSHSKFRGKVEEGTDPLQISLGF